MLTRAPSRGRRGRDGFTLVELLVVTVLMAIVTTGLLNAIMAQQRFYRGAAEIMRTRGGIRQAAGILPAELRGLSAGGGDIYAISDSSIKFRSMFGATVSCDTLSSATPKRVVIPGGGKLLTGNTLSAWEAVPGIGDGALIFDEGTSPGPQDDTWIMRTITDTQKVNKPCRNTGFTSGSDTLTKGWRLTLNLAVPASVIKGTPIRLYRPVRYKLYKSTDGRWYLGYSTCAIPPSTTCSALQPVSGPYRPYSATPGESGLSFYYFDVAGAATTDPAQVARIELVVRGESTQEIQFADTTEKYFRDSLRITIGLRNRT